MRLTTITCLQVKNKMMKRKKEYFVAGITLAVRSAVPWIMMLRGIISGLPFSWLNSLCTSRGCLQRFRHLFYALIRYSRSPPRLFRRWKKIKTQEIRFKYQLCNDKKEYNLQRAFLSRIRTAPFNHKTERHLKCSSLT